MAKLHLVMGMGETARTEIADRELASTRERPASRDESRKEIGLGLLVLARSTATVPKWGKELQPTEHPPAILHGVMGMVGHFLLEKCLARALELRFHDKSDELS